MIRILSVFFLGAFLAVSPALANGPALVTVTGNIENPNRGPADEFADAFFTSQDVEFQKAAAFDLESLEALGMKKITASYPDWPAEVTVEGPLLADVLAAAGAKGDTIVVRALDGYAPEIPMSDLTAYPVVLALKMNGEYLGLGGRGPAWIVYPRNDYPDLAETDDSKWVWSVFHMEVK